VCPSFFPYKWTGIATTIVGYGMRYPGWNNWQKNKYVLGRIPAPSNFVTLADSVAWLMGGGWSQFYYIFYPGNGVHQIHANRHSGNANILFLDGSVRRLNRGGILRLGDAEGPWNNWWPTAVRDDI